MTDAPTILAALALLLSLIQFLVHRRNGYATKSDMEKTEAEVLRLRDKQHKISNEVQKLIGEVEVLQGKMK